MRIVPRPSPNFGARRDGALPDIAVIHYTGMKDAEAALARLCDPTSQVSAHYVVEEDGTVHALVDEAQRAWHAGAGAWGNVRDVNSRSIGIELVNTGDAHYPDPQMAVLEELLAVLMARWEIPPERVIGHSDMAPDRKDDPGPRFDWKRLALAGLSIWPRAAAPEPIVDPGFFRAHLRTFGYPEAPQDRLLAAFRSRFRPRASGPLDGWDLALAAQLARRFPVDRERAGA